MRLHVSIKLVIAVLALPSWAIAAPEISVDRPTYDFGSIGQGKKVDHVFIIRNRGNAPLAIKSVRPSCGCTAIASSSTVIAPGKSGEIKASFNSTNYSGTVQKNITVESNDPKTPASILIIKGTVTEDIQLAPRQLDLGQVRIGVPKRASIIVTNKGKKPLRITAVRATLPQVSAASEKTRLEPGEAGTLSITITAHKGDRMLSGYVSLATDNPEKPVISIPLFGSTVN